MPTTAADFFATRLSYPYKAMTGAVPDAPALTAILTAALRVPDHGKLEPWRLVVLQRPDLARLADLAEARAREMGGDEQKIAKGRGQFDLGHLVVAVISSPKPSDKVPLWEQQLSAGALCLNLVNAASAAGWGAQWLTGWPALDAPFAARAFGCAGDEQVAGLIHIGGIGSPATDRPRPDPARIVQWGLGGLA
ncbi:nitroreductase family protein [Fuscibacter oryzae]|uniref:Putative NAD(P)H nitroreductase n=1 Tax=Fuscibacter oryzae TaxID=2803939 RepID=A0A8J7SU66_9RHOB|nr:nitroreductase [Fuscibacter oryzae]MBL4927301.1 nitroreductase [Fuscibacter oryzae]